MICRICASHISDSFLDLGTAPPSNSFLEAAQLTEFEAFYPLTLGVCRACFLVQLPNFVRRESNFNKDYVYFSSYSTTWLAHSKKYVEAITKRLGLNEKSLVIEIASNDGYLLQFVKQAGIPCLGVEPTSSTARESRKKGIETLELFFGIATAETIRKEKGPADLMIGNNVLAHVPDLHDFAGGFKKLLAEKGTVTFEFPHLLRMVEGAQFDTVYHEHYSYLSLLALKSLFSKTGLEIYDVEELETHGGSLRIYLSHPGVFKSTEEFKRVEALELSKGLGSLDWYSGFQGEADRIKYETLSFLIEQKRAGKKVMGYGAAAKGNTLFNFAGIRKDLLMEVVDASPHKQGKFLPGSRIPVVAETRIKAVKPDFIFVIPWNLTGEIEKQLGYAREWGGRFVAAVPKIRVW